MKKTVLILLALFSISCSNMISNYSQDPPPPEPEKAVLVSGDYSIDNDNGFIYTTNLTALMNITNGFEMRFMDKDGAWQEWENFASSRSLKIAYGNGAKTVTGQFRSITGHTIESVKNLTFIDRVTAPDGVPNDNFGSGVACSRDGNTFVVGAKNNDPNKLYLFKNYENNWSCSTINASDGVAGDLYGNNVVMSADGTVVACGSYMTNSIGRVYTYHYNGSTWIENKIIYTPAGGEVSVNFGYSIDLSDDGNTLAIGKNIQGTTNAVYIYKWNGTSWQSSGTLSVASNINFGFAVSLSGNGQCVAIGAPIYDSISPSVIASGTVYIYTLSGASWNLTTNIVTPDAEEDDRFGNAVSLNYSGDTLVASASRKDISGMQDHGKIYIYKKVGSTWNYSTALNPTLHDWAYFGNAVSINADGDFIAVGAYKGTGTRTSQGLVFTYTWNGTVWIADRITVLDALENDTFGTSLAIASDNDDLFVGAPTKCIKGNNTQGAVYIIR